MERNSNYGQFEGKRLDIEGKRNSKSCEIEIRANPKRLSLGRKGFGKEALYCEVEDCFFLTKEERLGC